MKYRLLSLATACTLLVACSKSGPPSSQAATPTAPVSGLNSSYFDSAVRPQDDLYRHINGKWLDSVEIPADKARYGSFYELADSAEAQLRALVESLQQAAPTDADAIKVRDVYASFMDEARLQTLGLQPLQAQLQAIDKLESQS